MHTMFANTVSTVSSASSVRHDGPGSGSRPLPGAGHDRGLDGLVSERGDDSGGEMTVAAADGADGADANTTYRFG
jgi:hypothetical protein